MAAPEDKPGFRKRIECPACRQNDFGAVYRNEQLVFWCFQCKMVWTVWRDIETIEDKQERI